MSQGDRKVGLESVGIEGASHIYWSLSVPALYEQAVRRSEGVISVDGPIVCSTGQHTGRSPNDKFIVKEPSSSSHVAWGKVNRPIDAEAFDGLHRRMLAHMRGKDLFVQDCWAGADPEFRLPIRIITERAWHSLFARHMFIPETDPQKRLQHDPQFTVIDVPSFTATKDADKTNSEVFILLNFAKKLVLIGGTNYAGEIKKSIFTVMNYILPLKDTMPMHCSANVGAKGDVALFFGLSGTGKTTLSSDADRQLIGDDEHGWSTTGVFNFEGGCYAKMIRLSAEAEPQIYETTRRFGTVLENVTCDPVTRALDLNDDAVTENTRGAYPLQFIDNALPGSQAGHPTNVVMLTADAFGVLPPIARLSPAGAMYHFLSGYTAKVAGTERGVTEPKATFSTCFGAPFMVWDPNVYARLLGERIARHNAKVWLVNTGWTGGPYGTGKRMKIAHTRAMITAALTGQLDNVKYQLDPVFNLEVPTAVPGVPADALTPRNTWADKNAYDAQAKKLATMFADNFKTFEKTAAPDVKAAGPKV
ncbi:MAG TPA: phosphoenolpyruvate carboxykinase [Vicinamibacterales bacterium]|nr:phosphoenolpyruvate carboxykinase [Vicinamibacterales bacterium]